MALFDAFSRRMEEGQFLRSCAVGAVALDLDHDGEVLRAALAAGLSDWADAVAEHFEFADARRRRSFAGLVLTAMESAYIRRRAERSSRLFSEAGAWLAALAERESWE